MSTIDDIASTLTSRKLASFLGQKEDLWFDAKSGHYDLDSPIGRFELAKDVTAFANSEGGFVVIGLQTAALAGEKTEVVSGLAFLTNAAFNAAKVSGVIQEYSYPPIQGLSIDWIEDIGGGGLGIGVIFVPEQPLDHRFVLMKHVVDDGIQLKQIVFGFAKRYDSHSVPLAIDHLHKMVQTGRTSISDRLTRIEGKVDHLIRLAEVPTAAGTTELSDYEKKMAERLEDLLEDLDHGRK